MVYLVQLLQREDAKFILIKLFVNTKIMLIKLFCTLTL